MIYEYNGSNLSDGLYYFYASWNSKCNILAERIIKLNIDFNNLNIYKVNTTRFNNLKKQLNIKKIPTYLYIKNGIIKEKLEGNFDYISLKKWIKERVI